MDIINIDEAVLKKEVAFPGGETPSLHLWKSIMTGQEKTEILSVIDSLNHDSSTYKVINYLSPSLTEDQKDTLWS